MPWEINYEFDTWRRIREWQGTEGWVHQSMVQGQRGILVTGRRHTLARRPEPGAPGVALVDAGVVGVLERCQGEWCEVTAGGFTGWLQREARSEEHTSELQSLMRNTYAVFCLAQTYRYN